MKAKLLAVVVAGLGLLLCTVPMLAHHSFAAEYDSAKPITLTGTVTKVEWMNPHARFYIDVKDEKGEMNNWELELGSPNGLMRQGWTRNSLKKGDVVTITGSLGLRVGYQVRHNTDVQPGIEKTDTLTTVGLIYETK